MSGGRIIRAAPSLNLIEGNNENEEDSKADFFPLSIRWERVGVRAAIPPSISVPKKRAI